MGNIKNIKFGNIEEIGFEVMPGEFYLVLHKSKNTKSLSLAAKQEFILFDDAGETDVISYDNFKKRYGIIKKVTKRVTISLE